MYQKQFKIISIIWGTILFLIFVLLTIISFMWKNDVKEYKGLENLLVEKTKEYFAKSDNYPKGIEVVTITLDDLKEKEVLTELKFKNDNCTGYVDVSIDGELIYKPYLKCKNYKTNGYTNPDNY